MNDQQENRLSRNEKDASFLQQKLDQLTATPAIKDILLPQLIAINKKMRDDDEHAVQDNTGYGDSKEDTEEKLENMADHVGSGLESYADDVDDFVLMNSVEFTLSQIRAFRDNRLLQYAQFVYGEANTPATREVLIAQHNITAQDIDDLDKLIEKYEVAMPLPQQMKGESVAWGKQVDRDLTEADKILVRIRRKMNTYRLTNPLLFDGWQAVDSVDDTGSHKTTERAVGAGQSERVQFIDYKADKLFTFESTGNTALSFQLFDKQAPTGKKVSVPAGGKITVALGDMAATGDELWVTNEDGTNAGSYRVS